MRAIEITIRFGDRSTADNGQVSWKESRVERVLVTGGDIESMKREAEKLARLYLARAVTESKKQ
jgi:hypothetical protein